jgi:hypothetical protein
MAIDDGACQVRRSQYRTLKDTELFDAAEEILQKATEGDPSRTFILVRNDVQHTVYGNDHAPQTAFTCNSDNPITTSLLTRCVLF